jgi:hypothetical protein
MLLKALDAFVVIVLIAPVADQFDALTKDIRDSLSTAPAAVLVTVNP